MVLRHIGKQIDFFIYVGSLCSAEISGRFMVWLLHQDRVIRCHGPQKFDKKNNTIYICNFFKFFVTVKIYVGSDNTTDDFSYSLAIVGTLFIRMYHWRLFPSNRIFCHCLH